jgi:hypothetical protein
MINDIALKIAFAAELLKIGNNPNEAFKAALTIFPNDTSLALKAATHWINDPIVVAEKSRLSENVDEKEFLPTRSDLARRVWDKMQLTPFPDDFAKLAKLYGEIMGFIEKPQQNSTNVNIVQNKVMIVKDHGTDDNWKDSLKIQQAKLIDAGATS